MPDKSKGIYDIGYQEVVHRGVKTVTTLNVPAIEELLQNLGTSYEYEVGYVPAGYEHRPDLISNVFYGTPQHWQLICLVNGVSDPFEGFNLNERILIPKL